MSIKEIVGAYGWEGFRQMEHVTLTDICTSIPQVVATGGGIILNEDNVTHMKKSGKIVWLRAKYETIKTRMMHDEDSLDFRPALTSNGSLSEIEEILASREPLYRKAMDFFVDTDDNDFRAITNIIVKKLNN
jgi:shikimate kinase